MPTLQASIQLVEFFRKNEKKKTTAKLVYCFTLEVFLVHGFHILRECSQLFYSCLFNYDSVFFLTLLFFHLQWLYCSVVFLFSSRFTFPPTCNFLFANPLMKKWASWLYSIFSKFYPSCSLFYYHIINLYYSMA